MHVFNFHNHWTGDPETALHHADEFAAKAIAADPNEPSGYVATALVAENLRHYERARTAIARALRLNPNDANALNVQGTLSIFTGQPDAAIEHIESAMRLDPGFSQQYLHFLGLAHLLMGHYETAATMFRERIRLVPETDTSRSALASALGHLGHIDEARRVWAELKKINPKYSFDNHTGRLPFEHAADVQRIADGLAKAGLPD